MSMSCHALNTLDAVRQIYGRVVACVGFSDGSVCSAGCSVGCDGVGGLFKQVVLRDTEQEDEDLSVVVKL